MILVGGAGGREACKKRKIDDNRSVIVYEHVKPQDSKKNLALQHNLHYKLPIDVVAQFDDCSFTYLGPWYVNEVKLCAGTEATNGFSFYRFELLARQVYWNNMASLKFHFGFDLSKRLSHWLIKYSSVM